MVTHLTTTAFLYLRPEDGRTTDRNMVVNILWIEVHNKFNMLLLAVYTFSNKDIIFLKAFRRKTLIPCMT